MANRPRNAFEGDDTLVPDTTTRDADIPMQRMKGAATGLYGKVFDNSKPLLSGETRELRPDGWDEFSLTDDQKADMGITDEMVPVLIRDPAYWEQFEHSNRARVFNREGGYVLQDERGQPFHHGDCVWGVIPRELHDQREKQRERETREFDALTDSEDTGQFDDIPKWDLETTAQLRSAKMRQHHANVASGLIGGQYSGMRLEAVINEIGREAFEATQDKYRRGGAHEVVIRTQGDANRVQAAREQARDGGGKFVGGSIPRVVASKNHAGSRSGK